MNRTEALNILKPKGNTLSDLKASYRQACKKYHPDINPNGLELMKLINCAYKFLQENIDKWTFTQTNSDTPLDEVLQAKFDAIKTFVNIKAEVCGSWLWVGGETWRYKKELKEAGFRWAFKKKKWYWRPEGYKKLGKKVFTMNEIRFKYGSLDLEGEQLTALG